jgi:hypothetical protein
MRSQTANPSLISSSAGSRIELHARLWNALRQPHSRQILIDLADEHGSATDAFDWLESVIERVQAFASALEPGARAIRKSYIRAFLARWTTRRFPHTG